MTTALAEPTVSEAPPAPSPSIIMDQVVFRCGDAAIRVGDVLDEAWLRGDLERPWRELQDGLGFESMASARGLEPDGSELQASSEAFRYERELLTAEETERWLAARSLTEDDFVSHLVLRYWHAHPPGRATTGREEYAAAGTELRDRLAREAMFSGAFESWARALAWRWTAVATDGDADDPTAVEREREAILARHGWEADELEGLVRRRGRDGDWLRNVLAREAAFRRSATRRLTPAVLARAVEARRIPLTQVTVETLVAPTLDAGREAFLCVRQGETTMEELAADCGFEFGTRGVLLGDCPEAQQRLLLAALPGEVLAPVALATGCAVTRLISKVEPDPEHPGTRARIEREWLEAEFTTLAAERIQWVLSDRRTS